MSAFSLGWNFPMIRIEEHLPTDGRKAYLTSHFSPFSTTILGRESFAQGLVRGAVMILLLSHLTECVVVDRRCVGPAALEGAA